MKQLGNLALVCAKRPSLHLEIHDGTASVYVGAGPDRAVLSARWDNDTEIERIIHELNFGKYCTDANTSTAETQWQRDEDALWNLLLKHRGHNVGIVSYGDPDNPADVCLECEDCGEVILDAELYTLSAREEN